MLRRYLRSMGSCIGYHNRGSRGSESSEDNPTLSHNRPLKHRKPKWKSNIRLTEAQLKAKREEFWDTAPAFEGRREIWDALKASVSALESGDYQMAQVILDGANISLPNGTLMDCYDELGNQYQLPVYILSAPINMIREGDEKDENEEEGIKKKLQGGQKKEQEGKQINIRIRFSTGDDRKLTVNTSESVAAVKRSLARCTPGIDPNTVRFFFAGKQLYNKMSLSSAKVESNFTIQALILDISPSSTPALQAIPLKLKDKPDRHQVMAKSQKQLSSIRTQQPSSRPKISIKAVADCGEGSNGESISSKNNENTNYSFDGFSNVNDSISNDNNSNNNYNDTSCKYNQIPKTMICSYNESSLKGNDNEQQQRHTTLDHQRIIKQQQTDLNRILHVQKDGSTPNTNEEDKLQIDNYNVDIQNNKFHPSSFPLESNNPQIQHTTQQLSEEKLHQSIFPKNPALIPEIEQSQTDYSQQQLILEHQQQQNVPFPPFQNCQNTCQQQQQYCKQPTTFNEASLEINS